MQAIRRMPYLSALFFLYLILIYMYGSFKDQKYFIPTAEELVDEGTRERVRSQRLKRQVEAQAIEEEGYDFSGTLFSLTEEESLPVFELEQNQEQDVLDC